METENVEVGEEVVEEVVVQKSRKDRSEKQKEQFIKARQRAYELRAERSKKKGNSSAVSTVVQAVKDGKLDRAPEPEEIEADPPPPEPEPEPAPAPPPPKKKTVTRRRIMVVEQTSSSEESESETEIILPPKKKKKLEEAPPAPPDDGLGKYMDRMFSL